MTGPRLEIVRVEPIFFGIFERKFYRLLERHIYTCPKTGETITSEAGDEFDGATGALDIYNSGFVPHDTCCRRGRWDSGKKITRAGAASILYYSQKARGGHVRAITWPVATYLFGCKIVRVNR